MTIPSGGGSEVLKRGAIDGNATWTTIRWDQPITASGNTATGTVAVPANCIVTILSMSFTSGTGSDSALAMKGEIDGSSGIYYLDNNNTTIPAYSTFVYSDKIVLGPTDKFFVYNSAVTDIHFCYIYQDWT